MNIKLISNFVECPYCGHKNLITYPVDDYKATDVIYCDLDEGGCDQPFVIENHSITFTSEVLEIKLKQKT